MTPDHEIRSMILDAGAVSCGFAKAEPVEESVCNLYRQWIHSGAHGTMHYLQRYDDVRFDPRLLLEGARTIISCAFNYNSSARATLPIARYALGRDYHKILRKKLSKVADAITAKFGGQARVCVDTAPILERYWAARAGVGFIGLNHQLIVPGVGSYVFLAEIIWTGTATPSAPLSADCGRCGRCLQACPTKAVSGLNLQTNGHTILCIDASKCLSYLTIEHRDAFAPQTHLHGRFYGCDLCQELCPHNYNAPSTTIAEFAPLSETINLTPEKIATFTDETYAQTFCHSAIRRCSLQSLRRNLTHNKL